MLFRLFFCAILFLFSVQTWASAFQLWEESADGVGDYHAGAAAHGQDASSIFYNPALATRFSRQEISAGAVYIPLRLDYTGSVSVRGSVFSVNQAAGDTDNIIPNFHYVLPLSSRWALAFEETTPFGLATQYPNTPNVNYLATQTNLETFNFNPSIAYQLNQIISIGAGLDALYGKAIYNDGLGRFAALSNHLSGWGYGYNAGLLATLSEKTRVGLSYRSGITISAKGTSEYDTASGKNYSTASADFPLPPTTMLSVYHDVTQRFAVMGSVFYTEWSVFRELIIHNIAFSTGTVTVATNENYRNTWNYSIGALYKMTRAISVEAGLGHDETPTKLGYRDIRLPDNNRYAASIGLNIQPSAHFAWSLGWTHFFARHTLVDNSLSHDASKSSSMVANIVGIGSVNSNVNVLGLQLTWML